jgi:hypothetical protein
VSQRGGMSLRHSNSPGGPKGTIVDDSALALSVPEIARPAGSARLPGRFKRTHQSDDDAPRTLFMRPSVPSENLRAWACSAATLCCHRHHDDVMNDAHRHTDADRRSRVRVDQWRGTNPRALECLSEPLPQALRVAGPASRHPRRPQRPVAPHLCRRACRSRSCRLGRDRQPEPRGVRGDAVT